MPPFKKMNVPYEGVPEKAPEEIKDSISIIAEVKNDGDINCTRCGRKYRKEDAKMVRLYEKFGCPHCGFPMSSNK